MRRREFIKLLGGAAATWPFAAHAQQRAIPAIGFLSRSSVPEASLRAFRQGLNGGGYIEGKNVAIEYRSADGHNERLPTLAADLVERQVDVIVAAGGGTSAAFSAKAATTKIPIVFLVGSDPVKLGFAASLNRPGGNLTGVNSFVFELGPKQLGMLHDLVPTALKIGMLVNPDNPGTELETAQTQAAAHAIERQLRIVSARTEDEIDAAYAVLVQERADGLIVGNDGFFLSRAGRLAALSARYAMPTVYARREYADAGGLTSYSTSETEAYRQLGVYAARILKGAKPANLPIMQSIKFELVINLKAAKALRLNVPEKLLNLADEVIE